MSTLKYLIAEQDGLREQAGIFPKKVKQAGYVKRAEWNYFRKKSREQDVIREQGGYFVRKKFNQKLHI